jgi:predicted nuclease of predicted toxin-antitoxin system
MKLLFDQNLSHRLPARVADLFPDSAHVRPAGLDRAPDDQIWDYAKNHGYCIVTTDADFAERSRL